MRLTCNLYLLRVVGEDGTQSTHLELLMSSACDCSSLEIRLTLFRVRAAVVNIYENWFSLQLISVAFPLPML